MGLLKKSAAKKTAKKVAKVCTQHKDKDGNACGRPACVICS